MTMMVIIMRYVFMSRVQYQSLVFKLIKVAIVVIWMATNTGSWMKPETRIINRNIISHRQIHHCASLEVVMMMMMMMNYQSLIFTMIKAIVCRWRWWWRRDRVEICGERDGGAAVETAGIPSASHCKIFSFFHSLCFRFLEIKKEIVVDL